MKVPSTSDPARGLALSALVAALFAPLLSIGCAQKPQAVGPARRVILITCDTLRADHLGTYGFERPTSPHVDAFAKENVVFERAYSTAPWTGPSLCALHTGKLPDEVGVPGGNRFPLPAQSVTLAELAKGGGYATAAVISNYVLRRPDKSLGDVGLQQGFDHYDDEMTVKEANRDIYERVAPDTTNAALGWLQQQKKAGDDRFFLWVHFQDPHGPYRPPPEWLKHFERPMTSEPELPIGKTVKGKDQIPSYQAQHDERHPEYYRIRYEAEIAYFDESFGRLVAELRNMNWWDDSLVIFSADHGESLGEHGYWFCHGENLYDEVVHVPLVIHFPESAKHVNGTRGVQGERVKDLVSHLDLWPTILEALGIRPLENRGTSLFRETLPQGRVCAQSFGPPGSPNRWEGVVDGPYALLVSRATGPMLFDLAKDPKELANLAPQESQRVIELARRRQEYVESHKSVPLKPVDVKRDPEAEKRLKSLGYTEGDEHDEHGEHEKQDKR